MKIGIIGAGLSGLTCAWYLKKNGISDIVIFEATDRPGGKLKTDKIEGYQLDRGFQVFLPAYPETKKVLDYDKLELQPFGKGALIYKKNKIIPFFDPENGFAALVKTIFRGPGSFQDKLKVMKLRWILNLMSVEWIFSIKETLSSMGYLRQLGFSYNMIEQFWVPFYKGVFLEDVLSTDCRMLQFTFKMFAKKGAAVPKEGMEAIPKQLVATLGEDKIRVNAKVTDFDAESITTVNGGIEKFDKVVLACAMNKNVGYNSVTNMYFETDTLPIDTKLVILNANHYSVVNNVVLLSNVAPNYATSGKQLISVSGNGVHEDVAIFIKDLKAMFGVDVYNWKFLKSYIIKEALPVVNFNSKYEPESADGVFRCGDFFVQGSINGAMESGRLAAEAIIRNINGRVLAAATR